MPSAFDPTTTPGKMSTQVGLVSAIVGGTRTPLGVTKGGADFNPETKTRAAEYDGRVHIAVGTDEIVEHGPSKIVFTVVEFPEKVLNLLAPGGTSVTAAGVTTMTPLAARRAIVAANLITAPWWELTFKDGSILRFEFDYGIVTNPEMLNTRDKDEASTRITIEARVDPTKPGYHTDMADYRRVIVPPPAAV